MQVGIVTHRLNLYVIDAIFGMHEGLSVIYNSVNFELKFEQIIWKNIQSEHISSQIRQLWKNLWT